MSVKIKSDWLRGRHPGYSGIGVGKIPHMNRPQDGPTSSYTQQGMSQGAHTRGEGPQVREGGRMASYGRLATLVSPSASTLRYFMYQVKKYKTYRFRVSHNFSYFLWQNHPNYASPHAPIIVLKTSDCCTWEPDNPVVCRVSSGNPESSTFYNSYRINNRVATTLQHLVQKYYTSELRKIYNIRL